LPGEVTEVVARGLEEWVEEQLRGNLQDPDLEGHLEHLDAIHLDLEDIAATYRPPAVILKLAIEAGRFPEGTAMVDDGVRRALLNYGEERGLKPIRRLRPQLVAQKILRARYGRNQLREVLTDFWYNHFNVDARAGAAVILAFDYEREAIRPNTLGRFRDLLEATARHPAMLNYLDNRLSRANEGATTAIGSQAARGGLNENYARELMELHTLGVDGEYSQHDVEEVARAFTGWTTLPSYPFFPNARPMERAERLRTQAQRRGFTLIEEGLFLFRPDWHDADPKSILGMEMPAGRGIEDGEAVLDLLSRHEATARFITRKLAIRFVADEPDDALVGRLADVFSATDGNIAAVLRALVQDVAFWQAADGPTKVKTPFEYVVSALRATGANVHDIRGLAPRLLAMGEPVYHCEPPTGFPDHTAAWVNAGALLNRMNFGLHLALGAIRGIEVDLPALNQHREPESVDAALKTYAKLLLPERDLDQTLALLLPLVQERDLAQRVNEAAQQTEMTSAPSIGDDSDSLFTSVSVSVDDDDTVAFVVGVILGSPQFQRQ
ncbi:MAG: DUF1800 domain-containing protein, partial [Bacteroidetes bacterium]|nr:DUF1800 domain-containing protein [Bacteroidota bacterium]